MDFSVALGDRITIVGANGVGKSTLFKMIYNELLPASGTIQRNHKLRVGYYHQHYASTIERLLIENGYEIVKPEEPQAQPTETDPS